MVAVTVVADTSAIARLLDNDLDHLLSRAFKLVLVPRHVESELRREGRRRRAKLKKLFREGVFKRCTDYEESLVSRWNIAIGRGPRQRNRGEAEALAQCQTCGIGTLFSDDYVAGQFALQMGFTVVRATEVVAMTGAT